MWSWRIIFPAFLWINFLSQVFQVCDIIQMGVKQHRIGKYIMKVESRVCPLMKAAAAADVAQKEIRSLCN